VAAALIAAAVPISSAVRADNVPAVLEGGRFLVIARNGADGEVASQAIADAGAIAEDTLPQLAAVTVQADSKTATKLAGDRRVMLARARIRALSVPDHKTETARYRREPLRISDPANKVDGLFWNLAAVKADQANRRTLGNADVVVGVLDTGIDADHSELRGKVAGQFDATADAAVPVCKTIFGYSDADNAAEFGGPANTDWNGHGTWMAGTLAANLDGAGMNGIAPNISLYDFKVSEWCGYTTDDTILSAIVTAADLGIDVLSISFGGYLDRSNAEEDALYKAYVAAVEYARSKGMLLVSAAGNDHVRIGEGGRVMSHGSLTTPGEEFIDRFGQYLVPAGIPGVLMVSATTNVTDAAKPECDTEPSDPDATCKRITDAHQPIGVGRTNQLAYYSNYGPRVDIAAPGGARRFNLPAADGGGGGGFPATMDVGTNAFFAFSVTSNWSLSVPCTVFEEGPFVTGECYASQQGTSMAAPAVAGIAALVVSVRPELRRNPDAITKVLKFSARQASNLTPPLSAYDRSPGDATGIACDSGFCHLGGQRITAKDAYGAGIVNANRATRVGNGREKNDGKDKD
jgi:lantibiotic leader peptide-processing serine protease